MLPEGIAVTLDRGSWTPAPIFRTVQAVGGISQPDIEATLNMGVGMAVVLPADSVAAATDVLPARGIESWVLGEAREASGEGASVVLRGTHTAG